MIVAIETIIPLLMKVVNSLSMRWIEIEIVRRSVLQKDSIETQHQKAIDDIINMNYGKVDSKCINQDIENVSINDDSIEE